MDALPYRFVVEGELSRRYGAAFEGMRVESCDGTTAIVGTVDQSQLQRVMDRIGDLGLKLVSVTRELSEPPAQAERRGVSPG